MSSKPKTRFVVPFDGTDREIFAVRELPDHSLLLVVKAEQRGDDPHTKEQVPIEIDRFSVHLSPNSPGTTLKRTVILADQRAITSVQFVRDSKTNLLAHLFTKCCPILADRYNLTPRSKDRVVRLTAFTQADLATLVVCVLVADSGHVMPIMPYHSLVEAAFKRFKIVVYYSLLNLPAMETSMSLATATAPQRVDDVVLEPREMAGGTPNLEDATLAATVLGHMEFCAATLVGKLADEAEATDPETTAVLREWPLWFHASAMHLAAGRAQRGGL